MRERMLDDLKRERIQARINHYFKRVRPQLGLSQKEMAKMLGYSLPAYRRLETSHDPENRLISSLEILKRFGELDGLEPAEFVRLLDKGRSLDSSTDGKLRNWEKDLLKSLAKVEGSVRRQWSEAVVHTRKKAVLEEAFMAMTAMLSMDSLDFSAITRLCKSLSEQQEE